MLSELQLKNLLSHAITRTTTFALAIAIVSGLTVALVHPAQTQTFKVIYNVGPSFAGLTPDAAGNFYGTTLGGGDWGSGSVFKLARKDSSWLLTTLYSFAGGDDGASPYARVVFGPDGSLYGATFGGGGTDGCGGGGCGIVFSLKPPATACRASPCQWAETVLHRFQGSDGAFPLLGDLVFDPEGNLYGATWQGGHPGCNTYGCGVVYELSRFGGGWKESIIHSFDGSEGGTPWSGVILDKAGNLYGTTYLAGSSGLGTVFKLTHSGLGWTNDALHDFQSADGTSPIAGLLFDQSGNLYGSTSSGGRAAGGTVFMLSPSNDDWIFSLLYSFGYSGSGFVYQGPWASLVLDANGNLYGTTFLDGLYGYGNVFKLTPGSGSWAYTSLHDFTGGSDGGEPAGSLVIDKDGNIYGTASGFYLGASVIFEITP